MVEVLLATYNGAGYIQSQINSILRQTCTDYTITVRDDQSTDETPSILDDYVRKYPDKIKVVKDSAHLGAFQSFAELIRQSTGDYLMLCDQDDVWLPEKMEMSVRAMAEQEVCHSSKPIIVCTDMYVADEKLTILHPSRSRFSALYPQYIRTFDDCAPTAGVTGCTMLFNREAKDCCVFPVPEIAMHDRWLCLCVLKEKGILYGIDKPLMYYRQHGSNSLGAGSVAASSVGFLYRVKHLRCIVKRHVEHYSLLSLLGYGSVFKYIKHTLKYRKRIKEGHY